MALTPQQAARLAELQAKKAGVAMPAQEAPAPMVEGPSGPVNREGPGVNALGPAGRFLIGAGRTAAETGPIPLARVLSKMGVPGAQRVLNNYQADVKENDAGTAGKVGGVAMDAALLMAPTPFGKMGPAAKLLGGAAQGTIQHQAQNYAREGEISPVGAAAEMALSTALPYAGGKLGPYLKSLGISSLRRGLGIPAKMMKGANPIDLEYALKNRLIPFRGGAPKIAENAGTLLDAADNQSDEALNRLGILFDAPKAGAQTRKAISDRVDAGGSRGLLPSQEESALPHVDDYLARAERMAKKEGLYSDGWDGMLPASMGKDLRQTAQANAKYIDGKTPKGMDLASEEFARSANSQMDDAVNLAGNQNLKSYRQGDKASVDAYNTAREESRKLTPLKIAAEEEAAKSRRLGLGVDLAIGGFGSGAALANPLSIIPAATVIGGRRMLFSPGGGRALYETGRAADAGASRWLGRKGLGLARAITYGVLKNKDEQ